MDKTTPSQATETEFSTVVGAKFRAKVHKPKFSTIVGKKFQAKVRTGLECPNCLEFVPSLLHHVCKRKDGRKAKKDKELGGFFGGYAMSKTACPKCGKRQWQLTPRRKTADSIEQLAVCQTVIGTFKFNGKTLPNVCGFALRLTQDIPAQKVLNAFRRQSDPLKRQRIAWKANNHNGLLPTAQIVTEL